MMETFGRDTLRRLPREPRRLCHVLFLTTVLASWGLSQISCLNDGKPGGFYPFPPPPPRPLPVIPSGGKSWKGNGGFGYPNGGGSIYPGNGGGISYPSTPNIFPSYPSGGKSWGTSGNVVPMPYPVYIPTGSGFGGGGGGYKKGLLSGLKSKIKNKFSGLKGMVGGGGGGSVIAMPAIYWPTSGFGGKFSKFNKGGYGGGFGGKFGHKYQPGSFGGSFGDLGIAQTGKSIGGGGGGWYPGGIYPGGGGGITYPTDGGSGTSCYDSSQCGMRSCCAMTKFGPKCQTLTAELLSRCIDAPPLPSRPIVPPIQVLPPRPQPPIQILPPRPPIQILPPRPPIQILPPTTGGKSWRPPPTIGLPDSDCRPGYCPRYLTGVAGQGGGSYCEVDSDCPYPQKCCVAIGSKSGYDRKRTCAYPSYSR